MEECSILLSVKDTIRHQFKNARFTRPYSTVLRELENEKRQVLSAIFTLEVLEKIASFSEELQVVSSEYGHDLYKNEKKISRLDLTSIFKGISIAMEVKDRKYDGSIATLLQTKYPRYTDIFKIIADICLIDSRSKYAPASAGWQVGQANGFIR